jgi:hypothetical protein
VRAQYISLFGAGDVTLQWGRKISGVDMVSASVDFYEFKASSTFIHSPNYSAQTLASQFEISAAVSWNPNIIMTDGGYCLADKLSASGIYIIRILDAAGNVTTYTIIIDTTQAAFAQNPQVDPSDVNIIHYDPSIPAYVGGGTAKLVTDNSGSSAFEHLKNVYIGNSSGGQGVVSKQGIKLFQNGGVNIPVTLIEKSENGGAYSKIYQRTNPSYQTSYCQVGSSTAMAVVYLFRMTDLTGNVAEHYVEVNPDMTKGIVLEDNIPVIYDLGIKPTAMLVHDGMIASRDYVTFSFEQSTGVWHVDEIRIAFYPFDFGLNSSGQQSAKYPFSVNPDPIDIINVSGWADGRHPIDINRNPKTGRGLYVIARICNNAPSDKIRNYHFIVDSNAVISNTNFDTGIKVQFGSTSSSPTATHANFHKPNTRMDPDKDPVLRANSAAYVLFPNGKYGTGDTFTVLTGNLSGSTAQVQFNGLKLTATVERRAPNTDVFVPYSSPTNLEDSGMYRIAFTDGSGGRSWILGADAPRPHDGNRSEVLIELNRQGPSGTFALNGKRLSPSTVNQDGNRYSTRFDKNTDRLTFTYIKEDTSNFMLPIKLYEPEVSVSSDGINFGGFSSSNIIRSEYTAGPVTYVELALSLKASSVNDGITFRVRLRNDGNQQRDLYLTLDNTPPEHNRGEIENKDQWYKDNKSAIASAKYPYKLNNNYIFGKAPGIYTFDTYRISYYEVNSQLSNISDEQVFEYNDARGAFSKIVGLKDDENRFFRIVERDEAGNRTEYFVQLRGDKYVDYLEVSGIIDYNTGRPGKQITGNLVGEMKNGIYEPIRGYEVEVGNIREFFANNLFFDFSVPGLSIKRLGFDKMYVNTVSGDATPERFATALQNMVDAGQGIGKVGGSIQFKLDNRFKNYSWELRQYTRNTQMFEVRVDTETANGISFKVNDSKFPAGLVNSNYFFIDVYELGSTNTLVKTENSKRNISVSNKRNEYRVVAYDEFGRVARYAHNGLYGSFIDFRFSESMSETVGGGLYVGSGVEFVYSTNAYVNVEIYRDGVAVFRDGQILKEEYKNIFIGWETVNDMIVYLMPEEGLSIEWRITAKRRGTDVPYEKEFILYGELAGLQFTNQSGDTKIPNGATVSGAVTVSILTEGLKFPSSVEFTRTYYDEDNNKQVEWTGIYQNATMYPLREEGIYEFTVTNALGFKSTPYKITIDDISNKYYKVYSGSGASKKPIEASPVSYYYATLNLYMPNFVVTSYMNLEITPTINSKWNGPFMVADISGTRIYRLQSEVTNKDIYLAVTLVSVTVFDSLLDTEPLEFELSAGSAFMSGASDSSSRVYYQLVYKPNQTITVTASINGSGWIGNKANVIHVKYKRDGEDAGELRGYIGRDEFHNETYMLEPLVISARDYGVYTFYVTDHAGNIRRFGVQEYFTLVNLARAPLHIAQGNAKSEPIQDGMIYNDTVYLTVRDLSAVYPNAYLALMKIYINNIEQKNLAYSADSKTSAKFTFAFSEPGNYRIEYRYELGNASGTVLQDGYFSFIIVSSTAAQQSFSFVVPENTEITSIKLDGVEIRKRFADVFLRQITLNSASGNGSYVVTLTTGKDNIYQTKRQKTFTVAISMLLPVEVRASIGYGTSTTSSVNLTVNPQALFNAYGDCRVLVICDGKVVENGNKTVGPAGNIVPSGNEWKLSVAAVGKYRVCVASVDSAVENGAVKGTVYYSQGFEITSGTNPLTIIIIVIVVIVIAVAVIFFIRLRTRMRVK